MVRKSLFCLLLKADSNQIITLKTVLANFNFEEFVETTTLLPLVEVDPERLMKPLKDNKFYKTNLPACLLNHDTIDMRLIDNQTKIYSQAVDQLLDKIQSRLSFVELLGISGCGKTGSIISAAEHVYIIYIQANPNPIFWC